MIEPNLNPPDEEEAYTEICPHCKKETDDTVYVRDGEIIGCEVCITKYEVWEWAEKNYISKEDYEAEMADQEREWRKYIND